MPVSFGLYKNFRTSEFRDPGILFGDYFVFNYNVSDGSDLDIRFGLLNPYVIDYVGWGAKERLTVNGVDIAFWAGDNTGLGRESVYISKSALLQVYPGLTTFQVDMRAFWYTTVGVNPVILNMDAYQGGTMVKSGFLWANPTATNRFPSSRSFPNTISLRTQNAATNGQRVARATIDFDAATIVYSAT